MARIGVVGAGRVGAVLSAALRSAGHEIVAAAGESTASLQRIETLLPGVRVAKPTDVARACDLLLLTVPDDMLEQRRHHARRRRRDPRGPGRLPHLRPPRPRRAGPAPPPSVRRPIAMHPAMTFTGTDLDLDRLPGCVFGMTAGDARAGVRRGAGRRPRGASRVGARGQAHALPRRVWPTAPTTWSPWSARRWSCWPRPAPRTRPRRCARCSPPRSTTRSPRATPRSPARSSAATWRRSARTCDDIAENAPATLPSYVAMARATADRAVLDGRLLPIRAAQARRACSTRRWCASVSPAPATAAHLPERQR